MPPKNHHVQWAAGGPAGSLRAHTSRREVEQVHRAILRAAEQRGAVEVQAAHAPTVDVDTVEELGIAEVPAEDSTYVANREIAVSIRLHRPVVNKRGKGRRGELVPSMLPLTTR